MTRDRIAAAPISWGVCEVPGWGHQLGPERVFGEMRDLGITASEFGPPGFLPAAPAERGAALGAYGLRPVGGFVALVLHEPGTDPMPAVDTELAACTAADADSLVLAADSTGSGYDGAADLDADGWRLLLTRLDGIAARAADRGVAATLHPHVGTIVQHAPDVDRVLDGCSVPLCLDTGHLLVGGVDPVALARTAGDRIGHVHLKDVDLALAEGVRAGGVAYSSAVRDGLYAPLGHGALDLAGLFAALDAAAYDGWYVLEQDIVLDAEPAAGDGPRRDVAASLETLSALAQAALP